MIEDRAPTPIPPEYENHPHVAAYRLSKVEERLLNGAKAFSSLRNWVAMALISSLGACVIVGISIGARTERFDALVKQLVETNLAVAKLTDTVADLKTTIVARQVTIESLQTTVATLQRSLDEIRRTQTAPGRRGL